MSDTKTISVIEDLLDTVNDGEKGFAEAAEKLDKDGNTALAAEMRDLSQQRLRMSNELKAVVAAEGGSAEAEEGTVAGAIHRTYMAMRDALTGDDPHAVLAAAEQGEDHAKAEFERALEEDIPASVRSVIERQYSDVKAAHDRVRDLRDANA